MKNVILEIDGKKLELHYKQLEWLTRSLGDEEYFAPLVKAILGLKIPSLTKLLVDNDNLSTEELDAIWQTAAPDLRLAMLDKRNFIDQLSDAQAREIMDANDPELLKKIAENAERLYPNEDGERAARISGQMADEILQMIAAHPDEEVKKALAKNCLAPAKFRPQLDMQRLSAHMDSDYVKYISAEDAHLFKNDNVDSLIAVAQNIEDIADKKTKAEMEEYLVNHPDPTVRLALARNWKTSRTLLASLAQDPDADIAAAARDNLE